MRLPRAGLLALAFCVAHAIELGFRMAPENQLWSCNVASLLAAVGLLSGSATANAAGGLLLLVGEPVWAYDLAHGGSFLPTSLLTHVGVAALSLVGMRRLGVPWRAWPAAVGALAAATVASAWSSSAAENVNVAIVTPAGFERFPSHGWYMAWLGTTLCLAMLGLMLVLRRVVVVPGDASGGPGDASGGPGDASGGPGDASGGQGDASGGPGDASGGPGDASGGPGEAASRPVKRRRGQ